MKILVKVACTSREVGYDFMLVVKQVINIQCQSHHFSAGNVIPCCPERRSESVVHMLKNVCLSRYWVFLGTENHHPEHVLF